MLVWFIENLARLAAALVKCQFDVRSGDVLVSIMKLFKPTCHNRFVGGIRMDPFHRKHTKDAVLFHEYHAAVSPWRVGDVIFERQIVCDKRLAFLKHCWRSHCRSEQPGSAWRTEHVAQVS